jgi:hypothetical protein
MMQPRKKQRKRGSAVDGSEAISVCIRIRPLVKHERGQKECIVSDDSEIRVSTAKKNHEFACSHVFNSSTSQATVFERCGVIPLLESSLHGYNSTIFAYGPTGCGKTFSVLGELSGKQHNTEGLIPRSIREMFHMKEMFEDRIIKLRVSCFEIYRETIHDLFVPAPDRSALLCREHPKYGFFVDGLLLQQCIEVNSTLLEVIEALRSRHTSNHLLNERSSRSHCMLTLHIDSLPANPEESSTPPTYGSITFVDLAGSERPKETGSSGNTLRDAGYINKSLYILGKVISGMVSSKGKRKQSIPFRDSSLTKLLIGSLGGTSKTMMFGCISPAASSAAETIRTLNFAYGVKGIKNKPKVQLDPREKLIQELRNEIDRLREENERLKDLFASTSPNSLRNHQLSYQLQQAEDTSFSYSQPTHSLTPSLRTNSNQQQYQSPNKVTHQPPQPVNQSLPSVFNTKSKPSVSKPPPRVSQTQQAIPLPLLSEVSPTAPTQNDKKTPMKQVAMTEEDVEKNKKEEELQLELEELLAQQLFDQLQI